MVPSSAFAGALFLSGAAGLVFQVVWLYRCGLVLGSSLAAVTIVLSTFMAGLAAGNALVALFAGRVRRPLLAYAALEALVAVTGITVTLTLTHVGGALAQRVHAAGGTGVTLDLARLVTAAAMLFVPSAAMGATLPLLVSALVQRGHRFGAALGELYGWNTLGAVVGVLVSEVLLIGRLGITGTAYVAAFLNIGAASLAVIAGRAAQRSSAARPALERDTTGEGRPATAWPLLAATAVAGAALLALEVAWFRLLSTYVLLTTLATSLMLAAVLSGIGIGGLIAAAWTRRSARAVSALPVIACAAGITVIGCYGLFHLTIPGSQASTWQGVLWLALLLTFPASCISGVLFTLTGAALHRGRSASASAGWLAMANCLGALSGAPLCAYVLLPSAGVEGAIAILSLVYIVAALLTARALDISREPGARGTIVRSLRLAAAAAVLIIATALAGQTAWQSHVAYAASTYGDDGAVVVASREGRSETLVVLQQQWLGQQVYSRLVTNGFSMSGTALQGQRYMRAFAYYPLLLHAEPLKRALVICYGVGVTVQAVTHLPEIETIDVVEISKEVVAMSDAIYPEEQKPLDDARVRLHTEDGRFFLQTTGEKFDLITGEPPPPSAPGAMNIYSREYFQLIYDRLAEGGIATYWVPVARPEPGVDIDTVISAFCEVFSDCSLWNATPFDLMLVGARSARTPPTLEQMSAPWRTPGLEARFREVGFERIEQIGATFIGDAAYLREFTASTPPLVDDYPQRLRPSAARPSLSDPRYGADPHVTGHYQSLIDPSSARKRFVNSAWIKERWPASLIDLTLPYFDVQAVVNRVYWEGGRPLHQIEDLDRLLTRTTLRTLPLWLLGSDEVKQRIAEHSDDPSGAVQYARALRAFSGRDYEAAARFLADARQRGLQGRTIAPLLAYALARLGQHDAVGQLAAAAQPGDDEERRFWQWLTTLLDVH